jgi:hypothetical protein
LKKRKMNSKPHNAFIILLLVGFINHGCTFPFGQQPADPEAPKNPFARSHVPFHAAQQDAPLSHPSMQQNPFAQSPRLFDPAESPNAADWPTPPPIGGESSAQQQSSFQNIPAQNPLSIPPSLPNTNNNLIRPNPNQQAFDLVTPPPLPQMGHQEDNRQNGLPKTPGEAHIWSKQQQVNQVRGSSNGNGNPFDNLPIQNTIKPQFQMSPQAGNPFDSLPIRNRQRRQVPDMASANAVPPVNPSVPNPAAPSGLPNVPSNPAAPNGIPNMPNPAAPNGMPNMPNPAAPN